MSKLTEAIHELSIEAGIDSELDNRSIIVGATAIIRNMARIINESSAKLSWNDIKISQPKNNAIKLFKDKNGKRIVGKFRKTDHEWGDKYWAVYDMLECKLLHDSITHWQDISNAEDSA